MSGGSFFQRDRNWHPAAYTPGYKTSVTRSPQKARTRLAFWGRNSPSKNATNNRFGTWGQMAPRSFFDL